MTTQNYSRLSLSDIDTELENIGVSQKTIQNYRGKILRFLQLMASRKEIMPTTETINIYFQRLDKEGVSKSVRLHARFALRSLFAITADQASAAHLDIIFHPQDLLRPYQDQMRSALREYGEENKYPSYRKELSRFIQQLPAELKKWDKDKVLTAMQEATGREGHLTKAYWYFLLFVARRPEFIFDLDIRFSPPLPQEKQVLWGELVKEKTTSQVLKRVYNRSAGLAHSWFVMKGVGREMTKEDIAEMTTYVLARTGPSFHPLVLKSLDIYRKEILLWEPGQ